VGLIRYF
jgi:Predicted transcriptional regulator containing an HTH domain and an uncharacterized domain shared with the mammalian protein Schlafen